MEKVTAEYVCCSLLAVFWNPFHINLFSCPSPAYHCRPAEYWLVGLHRCLVSVQVLFSVLFTSVWISAWEYSCSFW